LARVNGNVGTTRGFSNQVNAFVKKAQAARQEAYHEGLKDFRDALLTATPIDTGNLRASLQTSNAGEIKAGPYKEYGSQYNVASSNAIINAAGDGDRVSFVYRAPYARRLEYGFTGIDSLGRHYNQQGRFWIKATSKRFVSIMRAAATRVRNKS
jgi:hypothetical protein